ncbi:MAG: hypothetical protein ACP5I1_06830 [Candidatus Hinthialibacter sp.]
MIKSVDRYEFSSKDRILFDANIWLFLDSPNPPNDAKVQQYSKAFKKILQAKCTIYVDVLILSECINAYARIRHKHFLKDNPNASSEYLNYKIYRNSSHFQSVAEEIANFSRRIVSRCTRLDCPFNDMNMDALFNDFEKNPRDFNDQILSEICKLKKLLFITDDSDFKECDFLILTANPRLLQS